MAQTEIIKTNIPLFKPTNSRTPLEVGDTLTVILNSDDDVYVTKDLILTFVDNIRNEYGWDRLVADQDYRSLDIDRPHDKHVAHCS